MKTKLMLILTLLIGGTTLAMERSPSKGGFSPAYKPNKNIRSPMPSSKKARTASPEEKALSAMEVDQPTTNSPKKEEFLQPLPGNLPDELWLHILEYALAQDPRWVFEPAHSYVHGSTQAGSMRSVSHSARRLVYDLSLEKKLAFHNATNQELESAELSKQLRCFASLRSFGYYLHTQHAKTYAAISESAFIKVKALLAAGEDPKAICPTIKKSMLALATSKEQSVVAVQERNAYHLEKQLKRASIGALKKTPKKELANYITEVVIQARKIRKLLANNTVLGSPLPVVHTTPLLQQQVNPARPVRRRLNLDEVRALNFDAAADNNQGQ